MLASVTTSIITPSVHGDITVIYCPLNAQRHSENDAHSENTHGEEHRRSRGSFLDAPRPSQSSVSTHSAIHAGTIVTESTPSHHDATVTDSAGVNNRDTMVIELCWEATHTPLDTVLSCLDMVRERCACAVRAPHSRNNADNNNMVHERSEFAVSESESHQHKDQSSARAISHQNIVDVNLHAHQSSSLDATCMTELHSSQEREQLMSAARTIYHGHQSTMDTTYSTYSNSESWSRDKDAKYQSEEGNVSLHGSCVDQLLSGITLTCLKHDAYAHTKPPENTVVHGTSLEQQLLSEIACLKRERNAARLALRKAIRCTYVHNGSPQLRRDIRTSVCPAEVQVLVPEHQQQQECVLDENSILERSLAEAEVQVLEHKAHKDSALADKNVLEQRIAEAELRFLEYQMQCSERIAELEGSLREKDAECEGLLVENRKQSCDRAAELECSLREKDAEIEGLKEGFAAWGCTVKRLSKSCDDKEAEVRQCRCDCDMHASEVARLTRELESAAEVHAREVDRLTREVKGREAHVCTFKQDVAVYERDLEFLKEEIKRKEAEIRQLNTHVEDVSCEVQLLQHGNENSCTENGAKISGLEAENQVRVGWICMFLELLYWR
jgi:hypothetical protein